jgi:NTE family protein
MNKPFSLVLSGGGALGFAHLGVISDLEQKQLKPSEIVGTSMGAIIGSLLSIGLTSSEIKFRFEESINSSKKNFPISLPNWITFSLHRHTLMDTTKIESLFDKVFGERKMCDTKVPLKIVTTQFYNGQKKVFSKNDDVLIKDALLASMAIPGVFPSRNINGIEYVDGFLSENLGITQSEFNYIIASDVFGQNSFQSKNANSFFKFKNMAEKFEKSMRVIIANQTKTNIDSLLTQEKKINYIDIPTHRYKTYQFNKLKDISELGKDLVEI